MGNDRRLFCIMAGQRSGTTALRSLISQTDAFTDLGEPFDSAILEEPQSFFGYCARRRIGIADVLAGPRAEALCRDYVQHLWSVTRCPHMLIDIKHNSWGNIRTPWTFQHQEPFFLAHLKRERTRFLFVWRRDMVAQMLSDRIAARLGVWHNIEVGGDAAPFALDVAELEERARLMCLSEGFFYALIRDYPFARTLCYEQLFDADGCLSEAVRESICDLARERFTFRGPAVYRRNQVDKRAIVSNYGEAAEALARVVAEHRSAFLAQVSR
jgi:hypothetical protein